MSSGLMSAMALPKSQPPLCVAPRDAFETYRFNHHAIAHHHCRTCGCSPFAEGKTAQGTEMVEINLRCADGVDPDALEVTHYDGASV